MGISDNMNLIRQKKNEIDPNETKGRRRNLTEAAAEFNLEGNINFRKIVKTT